MHYGLDVLAADIEDNKANLTRFAVIGDETGPRSGNDKCALMFEVAHRAGALADAMNVFKRNRLNLTWIESFPIARPEGGYLFFVELEGTNPTPGFAGRSWLWAARRSGWTCWDPMPRWPPSNKMIPWCVLKDELRGSGASRAVSD